MFYLIFASNKRTSTGDGFRKNSDLVTRIPQILKTTALCSEYSSLLMEGETK